MSIHKVAHSEFIYEAASCVFFILDSTMNRRLQLSDFVQS